MRPLAIMKADRRYKPVRYHEAIETEALKQSVIVGIIRDQLDSLLPSRSRPFLTGESAARVHAACIAARGSVMSDRAAVVARAIMQMVVAAPRGGTNLKKR